MKNIYMLKDLAFVTGYSIETLKYYLKVELIKEVGRGPETRFRFFDDTTAGILKNIRQMRVEGLSIKQIKDKIGEQRGGE